MPLRIYRQAVEFGSPARPMVGIFHSPRTIQPGGAAVLLCNPLGQESVRSHRVFMVLADRLAQRGVPTLRFDYHGTGDSPGDDLAGDLDGWARDVVTAHSKLDMLARPATTAWFGLRLGGLLAASASVHCRAPVKSLVLWDPVIDGTAYLRELAIANRNTLMQAFSLNSEMLRELRSQEPTDDPEEVIGFALSPSLREQLRRAKGQAFVEARSESITVITSERDGEPRFREILAAGATVRQATYHRLAVSVDWATNDASGGTIVPAELVRLVIPSILGACL